MIDPQQILKGLDKEVSNLLANAESLKSQIPTMMAMIPEGEQKEKLKKQLEDAEIQISSIKEQLKKDLNSL